MKAAVAALALLASEAAAQGPGSEPLLVVLVGPPILASAAFDFGVLAQLFRDGTAPTGRSITTMVLGTVTAVISAICVGLGVTHRDSLAVWTVTSSAALAVGLGTVAVGVWGAAHPPEPPLEPTELPARPKEPDPQL